MGTSHNLPQPAAFGRPLQSEPGSGFAAAAERNLGPPNFQMKLSKSRRMHELAAAGYSDDVAHCVLCCVLRAVCVRCCALLLPLPRRCSAAATRAECCERGRRQRRRAARKVNQDLPLFDILEQFKLKERDSHWSVPSEKFSARTNLLCFSVVNDRSISIANRKLALASDISLNLVSFRF